MEVYIGIPCYQVADTIEGVLSRLLDVAPNTYVILVDDGSQDSLREVVNSIDTSGFLSFDALAHEHNKGYGAAQRTLFAAFQEKAQSPKDIMIFVHGDGQTNEEEIPRFIDVFQQSEVDAVLGSRMLLSYQDQRRNGRPAFKIIFDHVIRIILNLLFRLNYSTYASGYRAYTRKCLDMIDLNQTEDHHAFDTEMLLILGKHKISYSEIPVSVVNAVGKEEPKGKWWNYGKETIKLVLKHLRR